MTLIMKLRSNTTILEIVVIYTYESILFTATFYYLEFYFRGMFNL